MPAHVRSEVDRIAGSDVIAARNLDGGFSPGPAARCDLANGHTVFVKAAGIELNPITPAMHRREARVLAALPAAAPAPELLGVIDDGDWVALVISWIDGRMPTSPVDADDIDRITGLVERVSAIELDEAVPLEPMAHAHADLLGNWAQLAAGDATERVGLDTWSLTHLDELVDLEARAVDATAGDHLAHVDVRTDNMLFGATPADDVMVDWAAACRGASWFDVLGLLPSLHLDGAPEPETVFRTTRTSRTADAGDVDAFIAALAGYFVRNSLRAPPPGLPTLRPFQARQGEVALAWLRTRGALD